MKKYNLLFLTILIYASLHAQEASFASRLRQFSPLADIHISNLGLEDKNGSGTIDRGAGEGYETFIEKYGNADAGFYANGVIIGTNNGRLEENEILNHYYMNIRFKLAFAEETGIIDEAVKSYVYANNIPLVWLDDEQGTVMNAVNRVLGEGWNEREVSEDEAVKMFERAMRGMRIAGRTGQPSNNGGYYSLPEMVNRRAGYCFEIARSFGNWFFGQMKENSLIGSAYLTPSILHDVVIFDSGRIVDYFDMSKPYNISVEQWQRTNPLQDLATYFRSKTETNTKNQVNLLEQAVIYDKYNLTNIALLMYKYFTSKDPNYSEIIAIGEFAMQNIDQEQINEHSHESVVHNLNSIQSILEASYRNLNRH